MRVVAMAEPGNEDGLVVPLPAHRGLPQIVEQAADTVGRALQDDFRAGGTRHRLQGAGRVLLGIRPVRDLGAVEALDGVGASYPRRLRGAPLVARVPETAGQPLCVAPLGPALHPPPTRAPHPSP